MKDELISYDTAVLAKVKGFNEPVIEAWRKYDRFLSTDPAVDVMNAMAIPAPTQSLLQRWLREVHHIQVTPSVYQKVQERESLENYKEPGFHWLYEYQVWKEQVTGLDEFYTYESALEAGLQAALKLIPDAKPQP